MLFTKKGLENDICHILRQTAKCHNICQIIIIIINHNSYYLLKGLENDACHISRQTDILFTKRLEN